MTSLFVGFSSSPVTLVVVLAVALLFPILLSRLLVPLHLEVTFPLLVALFSRTSLLLVPLFSRGRLLRTLDRSESRHLLRVLPFSLQPVNDLRIEVWIR